MKKIFLTSFAALVTLASFSVLAGSLMPVSAPTIVDNPDALRGRQAAVVAENLLPAAAQPKAVQVPQPAPVQAVPAPASAPVVVTMQEPLAVVDAVAPTDPEIIAAAPEAVLPAAKPGHFLVSEWLVVPVPILERVRRTLGIAPPAIAVLPNDTPKLAVAMNESSPVPETIPATAPGETAKPVVRPLPEFVSTWSKVSAVISEHNRILPVPPPPDVPETTVAPVDVSVAANVPAPIVEAATAEAMPDASDASVGSHSTLLTFFSKVNSAIVERLGLDQSPLAEPVIREVDAAPGELPVANNEIVPAIDPGQSAASHVTPIPVAVSEPVEAETETAQPAARSFPNFITTLAQVSSALVNRVLLPVPAAPVATETMTAKSAPPAAVEPEAAKPAAKSSPDFITTLAQVSSALVRRALLPVPFAPAVAEPLPAAPDHLAIVSTRSTTARNEPAVAEPELAKAAVKSMPLIITTVSKVSSYVVERELAPPPDAPLASRKHFAAYDGNAAAASGQRMGIAGDSVLLAKQMPVLISGHASFSQAMLKPLDNGPLPFETLFADTLASSNNGPSIGSSPAAVFKANPATPVTANNAAGPLPVLISQNPGFSMDLLKPLNSSPMAAKPFYSPAAQQTRIGENRTSPGARAEIGYCDASFVGPPIRFSQTVELRLDDLLSQLHSRFGVNFIIGPEISKLPLNIKAGSIPWNVLLRSQLYISGVRATCIDSNTVELVLNNNVAELEKGRNQAERLESRYIKLKYLQPSSSGNKNIAGQSSGGGGGSGQGGSGQSQCQSGASGSQGGGMGQSGAGQTSIPQRCKFERLMNEIRQILGLNDAGAAGQTDTIRYPAPSGDQTSASFRPAEIPKRPYVGQVPGRNMLMVNASASQLKEIEELIRHADVPPFQVVIKGLIYTANEDKLRDIGVQTTIADIGSGRSTGGIFGHTLGSLGTLFDFSTLIGTIDFNVQASALQRNGVISIKSRPFATVLDGDTTDLTVGRQVPVLIQAINPVGGAPGTLQILQAANLLSVTPHVIDDEKGNPTAVNLELQLESNDVDQSVNSQGVPAISVRSIQSNFILHQEQTAILGGFTVDSDSRTVTKTPGLGDIPILGELFKRRVRSTQVNRLYFAISVTVIPYGGPIEPVQVPGANTDPPSLTPVLLDRAKRAEPKTVATPKKDPNR